MFAGAIEQKTEVLRGQHLPALEHRRHRNRRRHLTGDDLRRRQRVVDRPLGLSAARRFEGIYRIDIDENPKHHVF